MESLQFSDLRVAGLQNAIMLESETAFMYDITIIITSNGHEHCTFLT